MWQLHNVSTFEAYEQVLGPDGALEAAQQALEAGKIRHIAVTSHSMDVALEAVPSGHFETVQFPFNFVTHEPAQQLVPLAREHEVGFIAMKPLGGGLLSDANCGEYEAKCPYQLPIREMLVENIAFYEEALQAEGRD